MPIQPYELFGIIRLYQGILTGLGRAQSVVSSRLGIILLCVIAATKVAAIWS